MDAIGSDTKILLISNYTDTGQSFINITSDLLGKLTIGQAQLEEKNYRLGMNTK